MIVSEVLRAIRQRDPRRLTPLEVALRARVERPSARAADRTASLCFETRPRGRRGDGVWTIRFRRGEVSLLHGRVGRPDSTLIADHDTLVGVLEGTLHGVEEFLGGRLFVRGNLALPLELDDLLHPRARDPRSPRCRRVTAGGIDGFYLESGPVDGPPIVLLHGLGATSTSFLPTMWDLARDHHVFAVDLPGFGESDKPVRPLHAAYFAGWVVAFLDAVGIPRADLLGNSMGGRVAIEVALRAPERVNKLVLLTPSLAWRRFRVAARIVRLLQPELGALPLPMLHAVVLLSIRRMFAHPERVPAPAMKGAADEFVRYFATPRGRIAFFSAAREIYLEDPHGRRGFWTRLSTLKPPALFVFGTGDRLVPHRFQRYVQRALPQATFTLLDDCGHVPQFELPDRTNAIVRDFSAGDLRYNDGQRMTYAPSPSDTPFARLGGEVKVRALVERFYDAMTTFEPALARLHPCDAEGRVARASRDRFALFFIGWLGGPQDYVAQHGHPRLRMRHARVPVDTRMADAWMRCMRHAFDEEGISGDVRDYLDVRLGEVAMFMRNEPE